MTFFYDDVKNFIFESQTNGNDIGGYFNEDWKRMDLKNYFEENP